MSQPCCIDYVNKYFLLIASSLEAKLYSEPNLNLAKVICFVKKHRKVNYKMLGWLSSVMSKLQSRDAPACPLVGVSS